MSLFHPSHMVIPDMTPAICSRMGDLLLFYKTGACILKGGEEPNSET